MMDREQRLRLRKAAAQRAVERGRVIYVHCPACRVRVRVPYALSVRAVDGRLRDVDVHVLPFTHECGRGTPRPGV